MINLFSVTTWKNPKILKNIPLSRACCYFCFYLLCQWWWFSLHFFSCQRSWSTWYESNSISVKVGPCHTFLKETILFPFSHQSPVKSEKLLIIFPFWIANFPWCISALKLKPFECPNSLQVISFNSPCVDPEVLSLFSGFAFSNQDSRWFWNNK